MEVNVPQIIHNLSETIGQGQTYLRLFGIGHWGRWMHCSPATAKSDLGSGLPPIRNTKCLFKTISLFWHSKIKKQETAIFPKSKDYLSAMPGLFLECGFQGESAGPRLGGVVFKIQAMGGKSLLFVGEGFFFCVLHSGCHALSSLYLLKGEKMPSFT